MGLLGWFVVAVVSLALSYLLRPTAEPDVATAEPPGDAEMPTVQEGTEVPVFFGVVWSRDSTVVWWGDTTIETRSYEVTQDGGK